MLLLVRDTFVFILIIGGLALPFIRFAPRYGPVERVGLGVGLAIVVIYLFSTFVYLTGLDSRWHWLLTPIALLCIIYCRHEIDYLRHDLAVRAACLSWLLVSMWCLIFTALITSYVSGTWAGDWYEHYERARFFLEYWPVDHRFITVYPLPARPPLANLVTNALLGLGDLGYPTYQIFTCLFCTLVYFPLLSLSQLLGGRRIAATLLAPALMLNPFFLQNATFAWTKLPATFFVLTAIPLLIRSLREPVDRWHLPLAFLFLAAGTLTHYSAVIWFLALSIGWLAATISESRSIRSIFARGLPACTLAIALLSTWFGWALLRYGTAITFGSNTTVESTRQINLSHLMLIFLKNLFHTLIPQFQLPNDSWLIQTDRLAVMNNWFFHLYQETLTFTLGSLGLFLVAAGQVNRGPTVLSKNREGEFWWFSLSIAGFLGVGSVTWINVWGTAHLSLQPMVLLGLTWLTARLPNTWLKLPYWARTIAPVLLSIDFICGTILPFIIQHDVAKRFDQLNFPARVNYAGKLRLGQPFLSDILTAPAWIFVLGLIMLLGVACWSVIVTSKSSWIESP